MTATLAAARAIESRRDALLALTARPSIRRNLALYGTLHAYMEQLTDDLQAALIGETPDFTDDHPVLCPECNGAAWVDYGVAFGLWDVQPEPVDPQDCPVCHGDGTLHDGNSQPVIDTTNLRLWEEGQG